MRISPLAAIAFAIGCSTEDTSNLPKIGVDFAFAQKNKCQGVSPEIHLTAVPAGVASYEVKLTDLDVPNFKHWHETLAATGSTIREGAGSGFVGPCPPSGTHRYEIRVIARNADHRAVATGAKVVATGK